MVGCVYVWNFVCFFVQDYLLQESLIYDGPYFMKNYYLINKLTRGVIYFVKFFGFLHQPVMELSPNTFSPPSLNMRL